MARPWVIWITAVTCGMIVFGAIGAVTHITLTMEKKVYLQTEYDSRVTQAVDQMEEYVDALISRENSRTAADFSPIQTRFNQSPGTNEITVGNSFSPLFNDTPDNVKFYWYNELGNKLPNDQIVSPQNPDQQAFSAINQGDKANWGAASDNAKVNEQLNKILNGTSEWSLQQSQEADGADKYGYTNLGQMNYAASCVSLHYDQAEDVTNRDVQEELAKVYAENKSLWGTFDEEKRKDQAVLSRRMRSNTRNASFSKAGKYKVAKQEAEVRDLKVDYNSNVNVQLSVGNYLGNSGIAANPYFGIFEGAEVAPFSAFLVESELMLVRNVVTAQGSFVQGVWLDKDKIRQDLLDLAKPFLPNVSLLDVLEPINFETLGYGDGSDCRLEKLPFEVVPGLIPVDYGRVTPMRLNLIIAWLCIILAVIAVFIMFRGVMILSERRASFVSSVSHELRTPLTTFKLYSEMLADGMVKDPVKQQEYLETLSKESDRLTHMVENVLSFSQIEKGKSQRELYPMRLGAIFNQLEPNFRIRLAEEGMAWDNELTSDILNTEVKVEPTSVDQILTNLVDNAAKYGQKPEGGGAVRVSAKVESKHVCISISDEGRGIDKSQEKRLFKAFHKSDIEAAHSKPGVGLGLALSRSLAKSMGGDLSLVCSKEQDCGACVEIRLPLA